MFDLTRIRAETFVETIDFHAELASTNDRALARCEEPPGLPLLVLAQRQSAGRGRGGNRWWSGEGALTFSLLLAAPGMATQLLPASESQPVPDPRLSLITAIAVRETVAELLPDAHTGLKWPNDVYLGAIQASRTLRASGTLHAAQLHKVCGILCEVPPGRPGHIVLGIGLNVNASFAEAPLELQHAGTSLCDAGGPFELTEVLIRLLNFLEQSIFALSTGELDLRARWRPHCMLSGRKITHNAGPHVTAGICRGIDNSGALIVDGRDGRTRLYGGTISSTV